MFEIAQQDDDVGKFDISAKFYGVNVVEKVEVVFQVTTAQWYIKYTYCFIWQLNTGILLHFVHFYI